MSERKRARWIVRWSPHPWTDDTQGLVRVHVFASEEEARAYRDGVKGLPETAWTTMTSTESRAPA